MGIYIPGMEMLETGSYVVGVDNIKGRDVNVTVWKEKEQGRGLFYPVGIYKAVNVPQHGRLIDADEMRDEWLISGENDYIYDTNSFLNSIDNAPTIIEEEWENNGTA